VETHEQHAENTRSQAASAVIVLMIASLGFAWGAGVWGVSRAEAEARLPVIVILGALTLLIAVLGRRALTQIAAAAGLVSDLAGQLAQSQQETRHLRALPAVLRHDLRTPMNLVLGFCDTMLTSAHGYEEPLPAAYRADVELIRRNAHRLQELVETVLEAIQPEAAATGRPAPVTAQVTATVTTPGRPGAVADTPAVDGQTKPGLVVLAEDAATVELFRRYMTRYSVIGVRGVEEIGRLDTDTLVAVIVSDERSHDRIPEIAFLVGNELPILTCSLTSLEHLIAVGTNTGYLAKPVTLDALANALARAGQATPDILVIDDNRDNVEMFSRMIAALPQPTRLWKAYSGREGLALLREQHVDLVILDLVLPDMDGLALAQYLRAEPDLASIPLLLISSYQEAVAVSSAALGKIAVYALAGFQIPALMRHLELLVSQFEAAR
jgi:CheY-like chemotaxis protein